MQIKTGIDIIEVERIKKAIDSSNNKFLQRVYTDNEIAYCNSKNKLRYEHFAARFAAKEAVAKALGSGFRFGITLQDIEIIHDELGCPQVTLYNQALNRGYTISNNQQFKVYLTMSDEKEYANAVAVIESI